jgi:hypothetical protein
VESVQRATPACHWGPKAFSVAGGEASISRASLPAMAAFGAARMAGFVAPLRCLCAALRISLGLRCLPAVAGHFPALAVAAGVAGNVAQDSEAQYDPIKAHDAPRIDDEIHQ